MSDYDEDTHEIKFDQYFQQDDNEDEYDFDESDNFSVHDNTQSLKQTNKQVQQQPTFGNSSMNKNAQGSGTQNKQNVSKVVQKQIPQNKNYFGNKDESDNYDDSEDYQEESKHSQKQPVRGGKAKQQIDFDVDEESDDAFNNAFKYDKDEFKSEVSDSNDQVPLADDSFQRNKKFDGNFSIKQNNVDNPFATRQNINNNQSIISTQQNNANSRQQMNTNKPSSNIMQQQQSFGQVQQQPPKNTNQVLKQPTVQEIKIASTNNNNDVKTDSDVGFDDDIDDEGDHFSEEPIDDDDFDVSKQQSATKTTNNQQTQNKQGGAGMGGSTVIYNDTSSNTKNKQTNFSNNSKMPDQSLVNMASVVPNPKIVQNTSTINGTKTQNAKKQTIQNPFAHNKDERTEYPEFEYVKEEDEEDAMDEIHEKINAIPSRFSDIGPHNQQQNAQQAAKNSKVTGNQQNNNKKTQQREGSVTKKQNNTTNNNGNNTRQQSKPRPQTAKPSQQQNANTSANQTKKAQNNSGLPKPTNAVNKKRNNDDLGAVMDEEELKNDTQIIFPNNDNSGNNTEQNNNTTKNLLINRPKPNRMILRPESAKPKLGYEGNPNVLGKVKPLSANHNDLTAQLAQSKKFQMIKKMKFEKEKKQEMMTLRTLKQANVIKDKQKQHKEQQQQQQNNQGTNNGANNNNNQPLFKDEFEGDDFFEEMEEIKGDQAVGPSGGNMPQAAGMNDEFQDTLNNSVRQSVKDLAHNKKQQQPNTITTPQNNNNTQQINIANSTGNQTKAIAKQTPQSIAIQKQQQTTVDKKQNASQLLGGSKMGQNNERFNEILRQKKEKEVNKDVLGFMMEKNLRNQQEKQQQLENQVNRLAKDFQLKDDTKLNAQDAAQNKGSDKVPEHAKLVVDDEKLSKELMDLKRRFKETNLENLKISGNIELVENKKREKEALYDKIMNDKNLIKINGTLKMQGQDGSKNSTSLLYGIKLEDIPDFDKVIKERINPLDSVVKKFENKGMTLEQAFNLFDEDGDQVLTIQEIKNGIKLQDIDLLDTELRDLIKAIDANSDGVLTLEEWVNTLNPKFDAEKEFRQIMQNIDIEDPLILEERILDLRYRSQRIERELEIMRETAGDEQGFNYKDRVRRKMRNPLQKKYADKILNLEERLNNKISNIMLEKLQIESKIKQGLMAKDQVQQDYYEAQRIQDRIDTEYDMRLRSIQDNLNILDHKLNDLTQHSLLLKGERENMKTAISRMQVKITSMTEMETKLDKQLEQILGRAIDGKDLEMLYELDLKMLRQLNSGSNQKFNGFLNYLACVTIQRIFRGFIGRREAKVFKFQLERFARKLQPVVRAKLNKKRIESATYIQKMFRRYKQRKQQLEALRKKNEMKKLLEEEEDRNYKSYAQKMEAARTIVRYWREHKRRQMRDFTSIANMNHRNAFNKTIEVIYMPSIRKCFICKKNNAARLCPKCQDCLYCESCYIEYHARGHRKVHNYKRIRFGERPFDEKEADQDLQNYIKRQSTQENLNPNVINNNNILGVSANVQNTTSDLNKQSQIDKNSKQSNNNISMMDSFARDTLKNTEQNAKVNQEDDLISKDKHLEQQQQQQQQQKQSTLQKSNTTIKSQKSVKLSDEAFLKSIKQQCPRLRDELEFFNNDDETNNAFMRLMDMRKTLTSRFGIFKLQPDDIERLCEIANDKCQKQDYRGKDGDIGIYIDLIKLQNMINGNNIQTQ